MPISHELITEFKTLIDNYTRDGAGTHLKLKWNQDTHYHQLVLALEALHETMISNQNQLHDRSIINFLAPQALIFNRPDPAFAICLGIFLQSYQDKTHNLTLIPEVHLYVDDETGGLEFSQAFADQIFKERKLHQSQIDSFSREIERLTKEITQLKATVKQLERQSDELKQLKTKFKQLQEVNEQLHKAGIALLELDKLLICPQPNDTPETPSAEIPPPPPLPPAYAQATPPNASKKSVAKFGPESRGIPGQADLLAQLKTRFNMLAKKNTDMAQETTSTQASSAASTFFQQPPPETHQEKTPLTKNSYDRYQEVQRQTQGASLLEALQRRALATQGSDSGSDSESDDDETWENIALT